MMSKIRKMQDSWFAKSIFILTALSFMSLFGISGYINSAGQNRTVIKVDDIEIPQSEVYYIYEKQLQKTREIFGDRLDITDELRNKMLLGIVQGELTDAIIKTTAQKDNVVVGNDLIRKIIFSQNEFKNADGKFDAYKFKAFLAAYGMSENDYVNNLRLDIQRQLLVTNPVSMMNVPSFLTTFLGKIENQKRIFKYITINPENLNINRGISEDELAQYYQDFQDSFMAPEERDVSFMVISTEDIAEQYSPSQSEINEYYLANITQFETPEKRNVLQMVFDGEGNAKNALLELQNGKDFYSVAKDMASQSKEQTELGLVAKDMIIADMAEDVFEAKNNQVVGPVKSEFGWHVMKVTSIVPATKMDRKTAESKIVQDIKKEKSYEEAYNFTKKMEDKIGAGATLEDLAKEVNTQIEKVEGLSEDGAAKLVNAKYKSLVASNDFADTAFSYNSGELSQIVETDAGLLLLRVDDIVDARVKDITEVKPQIEKMWMSNERFAMAQELQNDVMNDLENGEEITDVAKRFNLTIMTSKPITRSESFNNLPTSQVSTLFQEKVGAPKVFENQGMKIIALTSEIVKDNTQLSKLEMDAIRARAASELTQEAANQLIESYGDGYDVRVKYRLLGLAD